MCIKRILDDVVELSCTSIYLVVEMPACNCNTEKSNKTPRSICTIRLYSFMLDKGNLLRIGYSNLLLVKLLDIYVCLLKFSASSKVMLALRKSLSENSCFS